MIKKALIRTSEFTVKSNWLNFDTRMIVSGVIYTTSYLIIIQFRSSKKQFTKTLYILTLTYI